MRTNRSYLAPGMLHITAILHVDHNLIVTAAVLKLILRPCYLFRVWHVPCAGKKGLEVPRTERSFSSHVEPTIHGPNKSGI